MKSHGQADEIRALLKNEVPFHAWAGRVFRMVTPQYAASRSLLSGEGAFQVGGRWNPPAAFPANYTSLQPGAAAEEAIRLFAAVGFNETEMQPRVFAAIRYKLQRVAPLNLAGSGEMRGVLASALTEDWKSLNRQGLESVGQCVGRLAVELGFEALLVPSARTAGENLVVFPQSILSGSEAAADGASALEKLAAT